MLDIGVIGGGINGLCCCAWRLSRDGHRVTLYERDAIMCATSRSSSALLHGGLRYLENGQFRLVREALREGDAWLRRSPEFSWPVRIVLPIYRMARRPRWLVGLGLFTYDHLAGRSLLPRASWVEGSRLQEVDPDLQAEDLLGGYEFSDTQMDDYQLGLWVARQAERCGVNMHENTEVISVNQRGDVNTVMGLRRHDAIVNVAGPWAQTIL